MKITKIPARKPDVIPSKKVAAYARVSTGKEEQFHSLEAQIDYYRSKILVNPAWTFTGIYSDGAKTGTSRNRPGFNALLKACREGEIDLVLTKSISRFARNTVDLLNVIRELKELGIAVLFERENIDTLSSDGELMLTLLASFAEEESRSNSDNVKWAIRKSYREGKLTQVRRMYGYDVTLGEVTIVPDEAKIVQEMFERSAKGELPGSICEDLNRRGIKTLTGKAWQVNRLNQILGNVFYTGDTLLQKNFVPENQVKKQVRNKGELPMYYVKNSHEAIISQDLFDLVQEQKASRRYKKKSDKKTVISGKIICGECGANYNRKYDRGVHKWICRTYRRDGPKGCPSKQIPESIIMEKVTEVLGLTDFDDLAFQSEVISITAYNGNRLVFLLKDHSEHELIWKDRSRSESWTEKMREEAGRKTKARSKRNGN